MTDAPDTSPERAPASSSGTAAPGEVEGGRGPNQSGQVGLAGSAPTGPASPLAIWRNQASLDLRLSLRNGESLLLTFAIPVLLLVFFSLVDVLPTGAEDPVDFLFPGVLALAVMSTSFVNLAIATGFERQAGVLKRLGSTPLTRGQLLAAKVASILAIQVAQAVILTVVALLLGFRFSAPQLGLALVAMAVATVAFTGLGLWMAGTLPALTTLAAANGTYIVLVLLSGMLFPLDELPGALAALGRLLPSGALAEILHGALGPADPARATAWLVLAAWAAITPVAATRWFRWE